MVVILCHWLCNALCAKSSVNSNSSMHNHVGILRGGAGKGKIPVTFVVETTTLRMSPSMTFRL